MSVAPGQTASYDVTFRYESGEGFDEKLLFEIPDSLFGRDMLLISRIADRDEQRAREFAEKCGSKASGVKVDVLDEAAMANVLKGADAVMTTVGPYYRFGLPVLRAAIRLDGSTMRRLRVVARPRTFARRSARRG